MGNISIQTSQNIAIEQIIASAGERIVATALDWIISGFYLIFVAFFIRTIHETKLFLVLYIPIIFYHLMCESLMNGQSFGKKILKIKVVKIDGTHVGFFSYFIRWIFRIIDISISFGSISLITIIINGKGQRIGDIAAHTSVIRLKNKVFRDTIFTKLPDNYKLVFPEVHNLTDSDLYTVKEVLAYMDQSELSVEAIVMSSKAKKAIEKKMGIQSDLSNKNFLHTVLFDYNFIHSK